MLRPAYKLLTDRRRGGEFALGFQFCEERTQSSAVELPFKRPRLSIAQFFVQPQSFFDLLQAGEVVWSQHLPLDDREINFHLIEPTGMHGRMNQDRLSVSLSQSSYRRLTTVRGAVVHDPERRDWPTGTAQSASPDRPSGRTSRFQSFPRSDPGLDRGERPRRQDTARRLLARTHVPLAWRVPAPSADVA